MRSFITRVGTKIKRLVGLHDADRNESMLPDEYVPREDIHEKLVQYLDGDDTLIHVAGQPGVGKTYLLDWVEEEFEDEYAVERVRLGSHHSLQTLTQKVYRTVLSDIPESVKEGDRELTGVRGSGSAMGCGLGAGASWTRNPPDWTENPFEYIEALEQMVDHVPDDHKRLICLDDIHNIDSDEQKIRDALIEISEALSPEITLLTAGRVQFTDGISVIRLSTFTETQAVDLLTRELPEIDPDTARRLHDRLSGHPYYLGLLVDIEDPAAAVEVPEDDIREYIEREYLDALSGDEERFLQATSPLTELDENVCSAVLSGDSFDQVGVRRLLRGLNKRVIVQDLGTGLSGVNRYAIHDKFRDFLLQHESDADEIHAAAFDFYADQIHNQIRSETTDFERETHATTLCTHHLSALINSNNHEDEIVNLLGTALGEDGFPFYTGTILLDELKAWPTDEVSDTIVTTVLASLQEREPLAQYFFDEEVDRSWAEELYEQGAFADPDVPQLQYLSNIVEVHPDFVIRVITNLDTDDPKTRRWLINTTADLPGDVAAETADVIESWVAESESFQQLDFYAIQLIQHLVKHDETEAALTVLRGVLQPPQRDANLNWQQDQQFERYELHELFQETRDVFVTDCGRDFIDALDAALRQTLDSGTDPEGEPVYESVAGRTPIPDLDYDEDNTGERKHILFTYLSRAAKQWVAADPADDKRKELITSYVEDPIPAFRRIGFFLLSHHPDTYQNIIADELGEEPNYDDDNIQYDFYRLVETAFPTLNDDQQDQIYQVLRDGPQDRQWIKDRAAHEAAERDRSEENIVEERVERWRLKRLYLLDGEVTDDQQEYIDDLVDKYGVPEGTASEPYTPSVRDGVVNERGPEELETLRTWSAETVLQMCVDWQPPEDQSWSFDDDERVEISHWGFAKQLSQLVEEQPVAYAEAISILEDAKPQYVDIVLDGFVDALQDGGQFPWPPVLAFCDTVLDEPGQWPSRSRTSIARLIGQGIQADQTEFPRQYTDRVENLLINLLTEVDLETAEEQPQSWKGGVGTSEEEVRQNGIDAVVSYLIWQGKNHRLDDEGLGEPLRGAITTRLIDDTALPVQTALGRHFQTFWAADKDLMQAHLDNLFPRGEDNEAKQLFSAAWNRYTERNPLLRSAFTDLRPYYMHAVDLLAEDESDEGWVTAAATAFHIGMAYVYEDESLNDETSLIRRFYDLMHPETVANVADAFARVLNNKDSPLHDHWETIRDLWQWRLDQVEREIAGIEGAAEYHQEFRAFTQCLQRSDARSLEDEQELVERTVPFLVHQAPHVRLLEEWLADQSETSPTAAISVYHAIIEAIPDDERYNFVRSSKDEMRNTLYTNAVREGDEAGKDAYRVANRFAAAGYDVDKNFLDSHLSEDSPE